MQNVVIIGASTKKERYAFKAHGMLNEYGHKVFPINPYGGEALGSEFFKSFDEFDEQIDTVTLYVQPKRLDGYIDAIISRKPKRVIFNPGTESVSAAKKFKDAGIESIEACTLVMLRTDQF
jgi:predicted CoA-binding protein